MIDANTIIKYVEHLIEDNHPGYAIPSAHALAVAHNVPDEVALDAIKVLVLRGRLVRVPDSALLVAAPDDVPWAGNEYERLLNVEALVRELIELENDIGGQRASAISDDDERDDETIWTELKELVDWPVSTEPELQHQRRCPHPQESCTCRRSHLIAEGRRLRELILRTEKRD